MRKSLLYGLLLLLMFSSVSYFSLELFLKIIFIIGVGSVIISGLFLRTFVGGKEFNVNAEPQEERGNRKIGLVIALFGLPFLITSIIIFSVTQ